MNITYPKSPIIRLEIPEECTDEQYMELLNNIENYKPYIKEQTNG